MGITVMAPCTEGSGRRPAMDCLWATPQPGQDTVQQVGVRSAEQSHRAKKSRVATIQVGLWRPPRPCPTPSSRESAGDGVLAVAV